MNKRTTPLVLIFLAAVVYYGFVDNMYEEVRFKMGEVKRVEQIIDNTISLGNLRDELLATRDNLDSLTRQKIVSTLPPFDEQSIPQAILDLEGIALQVPVILDDLSARVKPTGEGNLLSVEINFSVNTDYGSLKKFLSNFQTWLKAVKIDQLTIGPNYSGESQLSADFKVNAYFIGGNI